MEESDLVYFYINSCIQADWALNFWPYFKNLYNHFYYFFLLFCTIFWYL